MPVMFREIQEVRMITEFGIFMRDLRLEFNHTQSDTAKLLDVTPSYVSAVELGKRDVPKSWVDKIIEHYNLSDEKIKELSEAIYTSNSFTLKFGKVEGLRKECVLTLKNSLDTLTEEKINEIMKILEKYD